MKLVPASNSTQREVKRRAHRIRLLETIHAKLHLGTMLGRSEVRVRYHSEHSTDGQSLMISFGGDGYSAEYVSVVTMQDGNQE